MDSITTIPLREQLLASAKLVEKMLEEIEKYTDHELRRAINSLASDSTIARVLGIASESTIERVLGIASDSTIARVLDVASDSTIARVLGIASESTIERVLDVASGSTIARVLGLASDSTIARVLGIASDSTIARVESLQNLVVPVVTDLDKKIYESTKDGKCLDMSSWHCGTTHCRAGWAITLAGEAGSDLEDKVGPEFAGKLIYEASTGRFAPDFYASKNDALEDIKRCAGVDV